MNPIIFQTPIKCLCSITCRDHWLLCQIWGIVEERQKCSGVYARLDSTRLDSKLFPLRCKSDSKLFVCKKYQYANDESHPTRSVPWCFDLYSQSTMTSLSLTPRALKFFRTANASWSFCTRRFGFGRAIVGEKRPMP